jgi:hydrogenase maturation protease
VRFVIGGIGQWFRGDDAIGLELVEHWLPQQSLADDIKLVPITSPAAELPDIILQADAILLVDAMRSGRPAGTVLLVEDTTHPVYDPFWTSTHGLGTLDVIRMVRNLPGQQTKPIRLIGIEAKHVAMGDPFSEDVLRCIPTVMHLIEQEIQHLFRGKNEINT